MKVLSALSRFQKSPNTFIPVHMHMQLRPRRQNQLTIWNLPEELIIYILEGLHVKDLLNMRMAHPYFRDLIDDSSVVWASTSFLDSWPSDTNIKHFNKASEHGNVEALIKMAIAYLYNEGLPGDFDGKKVTNNGEKAAEMFCRIEELTPRTDPFTWLFIRPPWSLNGACCKECVFKYMKDHAQKTTDCRDIQVCIAKTIFLLDDDDKLQQGLQYLQQAAGQGSGLAAYLQWQQTFKHKVKDRGAKLESIRQLRDIANMGYLESKLELCKFYASRMFGGIHEEQAMAFVQEFVQSSSPSNTQGCFRTCQELTPSMRYILVDWLVEVTGMKDFSSHTLHVAVSVVDRYLKVHKTSRSKLQLLGVAAMVLCSRFLGKDIITIREAAWLTDNTYKYEDVVRMMGEITATLRGNLRIVTSLDFVDIFAMLAGLDRKCICLSEYICELSLLQAEMGQYTPAEISAASVLLARLLMKLETPWPKLMSQYTGYRIEDISRCAFHVHEKCFLEGSVVDHRDVTLQAVKLRYSDEKFYKVSEMQIMSYEELCTMLGVTEHILQGTDVRVKFKNDDELILSPSRKKRRCDRVYPNLQEREKTATPSIENNSLLNDSVLSGYDGDREDEEDSFLEYDADESFDSSKLDESIDGALGSESDTYFNISNSCANKHKPAITMTLNVSFNKVPPSSFSGLLSNYRANCDSHENSTSGVSSSPHSAGTPDIVPSTSGISQSIGISGRNTHTVFRPDSVFPDNCSSMESGEDCSSSHPSASSRQAEKRKLAPSSPSHMTLRKTTKRKSRRSLCNSASNSFVAQ